MFPLVINRFIRLHLPSFYKKVNFLAIVVFLLAYDIFILLFVYVKMLYQQSNPNLAVIMTQVLILVVMISSILFSILIFVKIHQMRKMAQGLQGKTLNDLFRAAIVCLMQPIYCLIYLVIFLTGLYSFDAIKQNSAKATEISPVLVQIYLYYRFFYLIIQEFVILVEISMLLCVLRAYRSGMRHIWNRVCRWSSTTTSIIPLQS